MFRSMNRPHFLCPFSCRQTSELFPLFAIVSHAALNVGVTVFGGGVHSGVGSAPLAQPSWIWGIALL